MEAMTAAAPPSNAPGLERQQFRNDDAGWVGVVKVNGRGEAVGDSVAPGATVWLSEAEKVLTAEAPQRPEDNPFLPQKRSRLNNETGQMEDVEVTPLVPVSEPRFVPGTERFVPGGEVDPRLRADASKPREPSPEEITQAPQPPARASAAVAGSLQGENPSEQRRTDVTPPAPPEEPATSADLAADEGSALASEETAAKVDPETGEETGAAVEPSGDAPEGEYAQAEEVGTPDAPAAITGPPAAPWSPGSSET